MKMEPVKRHLTRERPAECLAGSVSALGLNTKADRALVLQGRRFAPVCSMKRPKCGRASHLHHGRGADQAAGSRSDRGFQVLMRGGGSSLTRAWSLLYGLLLTENIINGLLGFPRNHVRNVWELGWRYRSLLRCDKGGLRFHSPALIAVSLCLKKISKNRRADAYAIQNTARPL